MYTPACGQCVTSLNICIDNMFGMLIRINIPGILIS